MVRKVAEEVAPFLLKCYEMVDDESSDGLISWGSNYDSFVIWDEVGFSTHLLPKYFKHNTFSSFVRQLNIYVRCYFLFIYSWVFNNFCDAVI